MMQSNPWFYIAAAYGISFAMLAGYFACLLAQKKQFETQLKFLQQKDVRSESSNG